MPSGRRRFVKAALGAIGAAIAGIIGVPLAGFFALPALKRTERRWLEVGPASDFAEGQVKKVLAKPLVAQVWPHETPRVALYALKEGGGKFTLYHIHCTHVGCPVRWNVQAGRFFSPCHGGVFDKDGRVLAGPPPRPLDRYEYKIERGVLYAGRLYRVIKGESGKIGPDLKQWRRYGSPILWAELMWSHALGMEAKVREFGLRWPKFEGNEMVDLIAYIQRELAPGPPPGR